MPATSINLFVNSFYETDVLQPGSETDVLIYRIRVNANIISATLGDITNDPPSVITDAVKLFAKVNKSAKAFGIKPRSVHIRRKIGTAPVQVWIYRRIPVLTRVAYDAINPASSFEYEGEGDWELVSKLPEESR